MEKPDCERRNEIAARLEQIPLDKAVEIGNGRKNGRPLTDPDCPYCRKVSEYFKTAKDITQYVFFIPLRMISSEFRDEGEVYTESEGSREGLL